MEMGKGLPWSCWSGQQECCLQSPVGDAFEGDVLRGREVPKAGWCPVHPFLGVSTPGSVTEQIKSWAVWNRWWKAELEDPQHPAEATSVLGVVTEARETSTASFPIPVGLRLQWISRLLTPCQGLHLSLGWGGDARL